MVGETLANRYEILEKVGDGGMALVYSAKDHLLSRVVAVKVLRSQFADDEQFVERFRREARSAASLSHPNIVNIYDVGEQGSIHYIVMEYVQGRTLHDLVHEHGPFPRSSWSAWASRSRWPSPRTTTASSIGISSPTTS